MRRALTPPGDRHRGPGQTETDLAGGTLSCPSCTGPLQPWGHARTRTVRDHGTSVVVLRPAAPGAAPAAAHSSHWNPVSQRGTNTIVITFAASTCSPCPVRTRCTTSASRRRQLTVHPRDVHQAQLTARTAQGTKDFQARYALLAGVEGTIRQAVAVTGIRKARYRGLGKTRLEHAHAAVAVNLIRLHAWWNGHPLDRTRTSHLARLELALAS